MNDEQGGLQSNQEVPKLGARVLKMTLEKFWGEKVAGDGKEPYEIIEGGDGLPTMMIREDGVDLNPPRELHGVDLSELASPKTETEKE
jgi:hypothetical protein